MRLPEVASAEEEDEEEEEDEDDEVVGAGVVFPKYSVLIQPNLPSTLTKLHEPSRAAT